MDATKISGELRDNDPGWGLSVYNQTLERVVNGSNG